MNAALRIGQHVFKRVNTEILEVPPGLLAWKGGGLRLTALPGANYYEIELGWKANPPTIEEIGEIARHFWPDNDYAMRLTHRNRILFWGKYAAEPTMAEDTQPDTTLPDNLERGETAAGDPPAGEADSQDPS